MPCLASSLPLSLSCGDVFDARGFLHGQKASSDKVSLTSLAKNIWSYFSQTLTIKNPELQLFMWYISVLYLLIHLFALHLFIIYILID